MEEITTMPEIAGTLADLAKSIDVVWVLMCAALVMIMQAGFALVEAGFTRQKNTVNILSKNVIDFAVGSLIFFAVGFGLMFGQTHGGFIGSLNLFFMDGHAGNLPDPAFLLFQTMFAATAATIVSGTMAERNLFLEFLF